jgi:hypothetical protein
MALRSPFEITPHVAQFVGIRQEWPFGHALLNHDWHKQKWTPINSYAA